MARAGSLLAEHRQRRTTIAHRVVGLVLAIGLVGAAPGQRPAGIVDVRSVVPDIVLDMRYFTPHNFIGRPIAGYRAERCLLSREAAEGLVEVQQRLRDFGLSLKVYDCYRPQSAVDDFVAWARDPADQRMKAEFYPSVDKARLFQDGYIAERSGHSRASTVDLTIVPRGAEDGDYDPTAPLRSCESALPDRSPDPSLDMGTGYDCFSTLSHTSDDRIGPEQRANRALLKTLMESAGFTNLAEEWWHYTLNDEPYPDRYFDFVVD